MPPEVLAHAMEPFFSARADGTGTGLGLAMVYGFIRQSGGDIAITSAPGQGTTVRLTLPLQAEARGTTCSLGRVVLVEDDAADRAAAVVVLAGISRKLDQATSSAGAQALMKTPVDLVVTDLTLQGRVDGWRLAEGALARWPDARAIIVSGHLPEVDPLSFRFPDRVVALAKPLTAEVLARAMAALFPAADDDAIRAGRDV